MVTPVLQDQAAPGDPRSGFARPRARAAAWASTTRGSSSTTSISGSGVSTSARQRVAAAQSDHEGALGSFGQEIGQDPEQHAREREVRPANTGSPPREDRPSAAAAPSPGARTRSRSRRGPRRQRSASQRGALPQLPAIVRQASELSISRPAMARSARTPPKARATGDHPRCRRPGQPPGTRRLSQPAPAPRARRRDRAAAAHRSEASIPKRGMHQKLTAQARGDAARDVDRPVGVNPIARPALRGAACVEPDQQRKGRAEQRRGDQDQREHQREEPVDGVAAARARAPSLS